jgi:L-asparaginase
VVGVERASGGGDRVVHHCRIHLDPGGPIAAGSHSICTMLWTVNGSREARPRLRIITTGGTIGSRVDPATGGAFPAVSAEELLSMTPGLSEIAEARATEFGLLQSWNIGPGTMVELARVVQESLEEEGVAGAIVTHGTDTMEETAFALDLLVDSERPVVMTGAMRNASEPDFDGPRNLVAAARVAATPEARGRGAMVVMNGEIQAARHVMKTNTTAFDAFSSPERGAMGVVGDTVLFHYELAPLPKLRPERAEEGVYLVKMAAGSDALFLRTLLEAGVAGVVIEGSGAGNVPDSWHDAIAALIVARIPVVLVSRCLTGRIVPGYGGRGGGATLRDLGVIDGGWLSGPKARIALSLALGAVEEVRDLFAALCPTTSG